MGWSIGFDNNWDRDIGYGVPAVCDHPECSNLIDRGLSYVCGGEPYGGSEGCGLYFCEEHLYMNPQRCDRCCKEEEPYQPKPDVLQWISWKLNDYSWQDWREQNPEKVYEMLTQMEEISDHQIST